MRTTLVAAVASSALLSGCIVPVPLGTAHRGPPASLDADWLDGTTELTADRLDRAIQVAARVPEGKALVDEGVARLGRGDVGAFRGRFSLCSPGDAPGLGGKTFLLGETQFVTRGDDYQEQLAKRTSGADVLDARVNEGPDYTTIERWLVPRICIQPAMPIRAAAEAVVHELVHALRRDPRMLPMDPATAPDDATYALGYVQIPGDEVDAYVVASRVRMAVDGSTAGVEPLLVRLLDPAGNPVAPRDAFARVILAPQPYGLGYSQGVLANALDKAKAAEVRVLSGKRALLVSYVDSRVEFEAALRKNVDVLTSNDAIFARNVEIARGNGDRAHVAEFQAKRDDGRRQLESTKARLEASRASEERVRAEIPAIDERLRLLGVSPG